MSWIILIVLIVALAVVIVMMLGSRGQKAQPSEPVDLASLGPLDARRGDSISIAARGHEFGDLDFSVDRVSEYRVGGDRWNELSGLSRGERVFMEVWDDDGVRVCLTGMDSEVAWSEIGLSEQDLIRLDESGTPGAAIEALGTVWVFEDSGEQFYFEDGVGEGEGCYAWEFAEQNGPRVLTIEKWEGEPFSAVLSEMVPPGDVTVYRG